MNDEPERRVVRLGEMRDRDRAVITLQHTVGSATVEDKVNVQQRRTHTRAGRTIDH
jgi:hypothetical protein